ncbi:MAG: hypothetical protein ACO3GW_06210 [Vulcanococcus sp.]
MASLDQTWRTLPVFEDRSPEFLDSVDAYLSQLANLSPMEREDLAVFKAAELVNALIQIREKKQSPDRFGPELAQASFALVRAVIRDRRICLAEGETINLQNARLREVIDEGCRLFHLGKKDPDLYQSALALSAAQCIALNDQLEDALRRYASGSGLNLPAPLIETVQQLFIESYRCP